jgi:hypothetical protein
MSDKLKSPAAPGYDGGCLISAGFQIFWMAEQKFSQIFLHILGKVPNRADSMQKWLTERQYANL